MMAVVVVVVAVVAVGISVAVVMVMTAPPPPRCAPADALLITKRGLRWRWVALGWMVVVDRAGACSDKEMVIGMAVGGGGWWWRWVVVDRGEACPDNEMVVGMVGVIIRKTKLKIH